MLSAEFVKRYVTGFSLIWNPYIESPRILSDNYSLLKKRGYLLQAPTFVWNKTITFLKRNSFLYFMK